MARCVAMPTRAQTGLLVSIRWPIKNESKDNEKMQMGRRNNLYTLMFLGVVSIGCTGQASSPATSRTESNSTNMRCDGNFKPIQFQRENSTHLIVADFYGASPDEPDVSTTVSEQITRSLKRFKEEIFRNPKEFDIDVPEDSLEIERLPCFIDNHTQAEEVAATLEADIVIWGQAHCKLVPPVEVEASTRVSLENAEMGRDSSVSVGNIEVNTNKPYLVCPKATLSSANRTYRRSTKLGMDLSSIGHLDLPTLRTTEPFSLLEFAMGLHFYGLEEYWLAARFFRKSADVVIAEERSIETLDQILGIAYWRLPDYEASLEHSKRALQKERGGQREGTLLRAIGAVLFDQNDYTEALKHFRRALAIDEGVLGPEHPNVAASLNNIAIVLDRQGDYVGALEHFRQALAIDEEAHGPDHPSVAMSLNNIANVLYKQGDYVGSLDKLGRALIVRKKALGPEHPDVAASLNNVAILLDTQGDYAGALEHHRRALAIREKALGPEHPDVAASLSNVGVIMGRQGDYTGALEHHRRALAIDEKTLGPEHLHVAMSLNNIGIVLDSQGGYSMALEHHQRALAILKKALGPEHPRVAESLNNIGGALVGLGDYVGALEHYRWALAIREKALGPEHPGIVLSLSNTGSVLARRGDYVGALEYLRRALAIGEKALGPEHPGFAYPLTAIGSTLVKQGSLDEASRHLERALEIREELGPDHPLVAATLLPLGELALARYEPDRAVEFIERGLSLNNAECTLALHFMLAKALWARNGSGDRARAVQAATKARDAYAAIANEPRRIEAADWLAKHRRP